MLDWLEIQFFKVAKWLIIRGYGCRCKEEDYDENCAECEAGRMVRWISQHIENIKY